MGTGSGDHFDVVVVGAGVVGSSVAWRLAERGAQTLLVDVDLEGVLSSSELNAGGVRATWNQPINIALSRASIDFFAQNAQETGYRDCGYLWLRSPENWSAAQAARQLQNRLGWEVQALTPADIQTKAPFLDRLDGVAGATFSPRDGLINPNLLKLLYRARGRQAGLIQRDRHWLQAARRVPSVSGSRLWELDFSVFSAALSVDDRREILSLQQQPQAQKARVTANQVVNCAGAWAAPVAKILGYETPAYAVRRQISLFDSRDLDLSPYGMIVDTSGVYFHPEASYGLAGFGSPQERPGYRFDYDGEAFFEERIWPALHERSSRLERLKHLSGWAGLYEVSPDESGIVGPAVGVDGVWEAHSFSGHGVMQSAAVGSGLAEWISTGRATEYDLAVLAPNRFSQNRLVSESLII